MPIAGLRDLLGGNAEGLDGQRFLGLTLGHDRNTHEDQGEDEEGDLLDPDPPHRPPEPPSGAAPETLQGIVIQDQQDRRQTHGNCLAQQRRREKKE
jgi:hypothetical protein